MTARTQRVGVYVALVLLVAAGFLRQRATLDELHDLVRSEEAEEQVEQAQACVSQWERVPQLRDAIEQSVSAGSAAGAGAVFDVAGQLAEGPLPPETGELLEQAVDQRVRLVVQEIVAGYPDPACDLEGAQAALGQQG